MKTLLITWAGVLAIGISLPAFAGPDWQLLEQARNNQRASMQRETKTRPAPAANAPGAKRIVLPLDHGPRAQTTPWENQQRLLRRQQEIPGKTDGDEAASHASRK